MRVFFFRVCYNPDCEWKQMERETFFRLNVAVTSFVQQEISILEGGQRRSDRVRVYDRVWDWVWVSRLWFVKVNFTFTFRCVTSCLHLDIIVIG